MCEQIQKRFFDHLPGRIRCGTCLDKAMLHWSQKGVGVRVYEYVELPNNLWQYLLLDLDYEGAGAAWYERRLPHPTIILRTKRNGHSLYFYELERPVLRPGTGNCQDVRSGPLEYFENVVRGYQAVLKADAGYEAVNCKNPLHPTWTRDAIWLDRQYTLLELARHLPEVPSSPSARDRGMRSASTSPNARLFDAGRRWGMSNVGSFEAYGDFEAGLEDLLTSEVQNNFSGKVPVHLLPAWAKKIATYMWSRKSEYAKHRGVMNFEPVRVGQDQAEREVEIRRRQSLGAAYTNELRRNNAKQSVQAACHRLQESGERVSVAAVAREAGCDRKTARKYMGTLEPGVIGRAD